MNPSHSAAPVHEIPGPEGVRLWEAGLDVAADMRKSLAATLSAAERDRASEFLHPRDASRYEVAHGTLRAVLAELTGVAGSDLEIDLEPDSDKPRLASPHGIVFNISHCNDRLLIATAASEAVRAVGVDLEEVRQLPEGEATGIARRFFSPRERDLVQGFKDPVQRAAAFFACWTRKEAVVKGLGTGLDTPLSQFEVGAREVMPLVADRALHEQLRGWTVHSVDIGTGWLAALALLRSESGI